MYKERDRKMKTRGIELAEKRDRIRCMVRDIE